MPIIAGNTYPSLDDKEILLSNDIQSAKEFALFNEQIREVLTLPKSLGEVHLPYNKRPKLDVDHLIPEQMIARGTIDGKTGYRDMKTGKFLGEEKIPGRDPYRDIKFDWLEARERYKAVNGKLVILGGPIGDASSISSQCGSAIGTILGMKLYTGDDWDIFDKQHEFLGKQTVMASAHVDDLLMPEGWWHAGSGICLSGNTGGLKGDMYYDRLDKFRIENNG